MANSLASELWELYRFLGGGVCLGLLSGWKLPHIYSAYLGKGLFWVGVPISIITFLRQADLSGSVWIAPAIAWTSIALGAGCSWLWIRALKRWSSNPLTARPTQGSFILAATIGNTGYMGYPVTLALAGTQYFAWALFYDLIGNTLSAYSIGVAFAASYGEGEQKRSQLFRAIAQNPVLWCFGFGLLFRQVPLPEPAEQVLERLAWTSLFLSLVLIGMRLSQLTSWQSLRQASVSLVVKMLVVPLIVGAGLSMLGMSGAPRLVMVLQTAMPPAFATLILSEAYHLDRQFTVTALAVGSVGLLATLPLWIWLFGV